MDTIKELSQAMYEAWLEYRHAEGHEGHQEAWVAFSVARQSYLKAMASPTHNANPREVCVGLP